MIVGITGPVCSGKEALVMYLVQTYGFEAVNLQNLFKKKLKKLK
jgi:dephospho-CoA kinase